MIWNFYFSGILYGRIREENETLTIQSLNIETGCLGEEKAFKEEENSFFQGLCSRDIRGFFSKKERYEEEISRGKEGFVLNGERFTRRREEAYVLRDRKFPLDLFYENGKIWAVLMSGRDYTGVLVKEGLEERTVLSRWTKAYPDENSFGVCFCGTEMVQTRDGESLASDVYLPAVKSATAGQQRWPAVLIRTPYGKRRGVEVYYRFVQRGYAVVIQDVRGREDSTGEWKPQHYEIEDGDDTLNWIAAQPWSDGTVGMTGGSYLGYVQWAAAASGNPHLKAMLSSVCAGSAFADLPRRGGCFNSGMLAWGFAMSEQRMRPELMAQDNWDEILDIRPIQTIPQKALGHEVPFLTEWLKHKDMDDFWEKGNWQKNYKGGPVPALIMSGWFDDNGMGTTEALDLVKDWPEGTWKAVLGPWKHSANADYDLHGVYLGEDALRYDMDLLCMMWLEHFLKGVDNGIEKTPALEYYTVGENRWKTGESWPPRDTEEIILYLDGETDHAAMGNGAGCGKGSLRFEPSAGKGRDCYVYDPENPSVHIVDMSENELEIPEDYTRMEWREDMLAYTTEPFTKSCVITGELAVTLYISCDCPDTDFMVRITDVDEQGRSIKLADGVLSAKYRNGFEKAEYLEPDGIYEITIRTTKISNAFLPGHRLRLTVTSSGKNFIFPNSNTRDGFDSAFVQKAHITVHRGPKTPSRAVMKRENTRG